MDYFDFLAYLIMSGVQEKLVAELGQKMIELFERGIENPDRFASLTKLSKVEAMRIVANYNKDLPTATLRAFTQALEREDEQLNKLFENAFGKREGLSNIADNIANNAAIGMSEIMRRQNIALADTQADIWYKVTAEAILRDQSGEARKDVIERAVRQLARNSLTTIDYKSGRQTQIDSAIKRHVFTQANQARNRLLFYRMDEWECDLVFTSAHYGARPDHAEWQGKVYSRSGKSKKYPSLVEATGYGTVTGLCGANCRHTMTPYVEGYSKLPNTDYSSQERLTGLSSDEYYKATQKQRRLERDIRQTKREIKALEDMGLDATKEKRVLRKQQAKVRSHVKQNKLMRDYDRERLWGVRKTGISRTQKPQNSGRKSCGAISGALTDANDKSENLRKAHAKMYYRSVRNRDSKLEVEVISSNTGFTKSQIRAVYEHIFIKKHHLDDGYRRFHTNYDMAQSWARLRSGLNIQEHDIILIQHELKEIEFMKKGLPQRKAHEMADQYFNYAKACDEWKKRNGYL